MVSSCLKDGLKVLRTDSAKTSTCIVKYIGEASHGHASCILSWADHADLKGEYMVVYGRQWKCEAKLERMTRSDQFRGVTK